MKNKIKPPATRKQNWQKMGLSVLVVAGCLAIILLNLSHMTTPPWQTEFQTDYMSDFVENNQQEGFLIDQSKKRLMKVSRDNDTYQLEWAKYGNRGNLKLFYNAVDLAADDKGNVYVTDLILELDGSTVSGEKILAYDRNGNYLKTMWEVLYTENHPISKGRLYSLTVRGDTLSYIYKEADALCLYETSLSTSTGPRLRLRYACDTSQLVSFAIDSERSKVYCATKKGQIAALSYEGDWEIRYEGSAHNEEDYFSVPWGMSVDAQTGELYFSDIGLRRISVLGIDGTVRYLSGASNVTHIQDFPIDYIVHSTATPLHVTTASDDLGAIHYSLSTQILRWLLWIVALEIVFSLNKIGQLAVKLKFRVDFSEAGRMGLVVFAVAAIMSVSVSALVISNMQTRYTDEVMNRISAVAEITANSLIPENVKAINTPEDYGSPEYQVLQKQIAKSFREIEGNKGLYCVLNRVAENGIIYSCLYLEDTVGSYYPLDWSYYGSEYQELYETGKQIRFENISNTDGSWLYTLTPVFDRDGSVIAAMEVGTNLSAFQESTSMLLWEISLSVISMAAVIILIFTEFTSFSYSNRARQKVIAESPQPERERRRVMVDVVRPVIFIIFTADCLATAFLPILANQIARPLFGLSAEFISAIPISAELLVTAIFAFIGGYIIEKIGIRFVLLTGCFCSAVGFALAGASSEIGLFTLAKCVIGIGLGLIIISCNTLVASFPEEDRDQGFAFYNSGSLSGITVGTSIGAFLVIWLGYFKVYYVAAMMAAMAVLFVMWQIKKNPILPPPPQKTKDAPKQESLFRFLLHRRVIWYFLGAMMPYILFGYFFSYFVPLFAESAGMSEATIGQLFLINGLCVIYLGPSLTKLMLQKLRPKNSILIAVAIYVVALVLFALFPGVAMITISALLFGIADSFGLSALSVYFSGLTEVQNYGSGRSMGISNTLENVAQCIGPFVFSMLYVMGVQQGLLLLTTGFVGLMVIFFFTSIKGKKHSS